MKKPEPVEALPGSNIIFTGVVSGTPPLKLKWFRGSSEIISGRSCAITLQGTTASLELFKVDTSKSGEYTCQITNDAGKESCTTNLFVKGWSLIFFK